MIALQCDLSVLSCPFGVHRTSVHFEYCHPELILDVCDTNCLPADLQ